MIYRATDNKRAGGRRAKSDRWQRTSSSPIVGTGGLYDGRGSLREPVIRPTVGGPGQPDRIRPLESSLVNLTGRIGQQQEAAGIGGPPQLANDLPHCFEQRKGHATVQLEWPDAGQRETIACNGQGSRGLSDGSHGSVGLGGPKQEQEQEQERPPGYRYLFVQMAIIKRAGDMRRAADLDNNRIAQSGGDLQSFEV